MSGKPNSPVSKQKDSPPTVPSLPAAVTPLHAQKSQTVAVPYPSLSVITNRDKHRVETEKSHLHPIQTNMVPSSSLSFTNDRTKIQHVLGNYEAEPAELSSEYFEHVLTGEVALGAGSFGVVVLVKDIVLKKQFAVKTMRLGLDKD